MNLSVRVPASPTSLSQYSQLYAELLHRKPAVNCDVKLYSDHYLVTFSPRWLTGNTWNDDTIWACQQALAGAISALGLQASTPKSASARVAGRTHTTSLPDTLSMTAFAALRDREPHIRELWDAVRSGTHVLLHGDPACGKTVALRCFATWLGPAMWSCDLTSVTQVGFVNAAVEAVGRGAKVFGLEECEKASPSILRSLLPLIDGRQCIERITAGRATHCPAPVVVLATCNSVAKLAKKLDGSVLSRFAIQQPWNRPSREAMVLLLLAVPGATAAQVQVIMTTLWDRFGCRDPRMLKGWLSGGDRLLDGSYVRDWCTIHGVRL